MKIALIGGSGFVGSAALTEALQRGHQVTALARDPAKLPARAGLTAVKANVLDAAQVAAAVEGHDAVIDAYNPGWNAPDLYDTFLKGTRAIVAGVSVRASSASSSSAAPAACMLRPACSWSIPTGSRATCRRTSFPAHRPHATR